jgi:hypothetical protein
MALEATWYSTIGGDAGEQLDYSGGSSIGHLVNAGEAYVPPQSHIVRIVASGGATVYGHTDSDLFFPARPHLWLYEIYSQRRPVAHPDGPGPAHQHCHEGGAMTMSQSVIPRDPTAFTGSARNVSTTYTGNITPVDQRCSFGSVGIDDGPWYIYARMDIHGLHDLLGADGYATHFYDYKARFVLKVLYEHLVP